MAILTVKINSQPLKKPLFCHIKRDFRVKIVLMVHRMLKLSKFGSHEIKSQKTNILGAGHAQKQISKSAVVLTRSED